MKKPSLVVTTAFAGLCLALGACGSDGPDTPSSASGDTPQASLTPASSPTVADLEDNGDLAVGDYTASLFQPRFSFSIDESGWYAGRPTEDFQPFNIYPEHPEWYLIFIRPDEVYDPEKRGPAEIPGPRDFVAWLEKHPQFATTPSEEITIGGIEFQAFEAEVARPRSTCDDEGTEVPCALVAPIEGDAPLRYREGSHVRFYVNHEAGRPLLISIEAPEDEFATFAPMAEKVLQSVEFLDAL